MSDSIDRLMEDQGSNFMDYYAANDKDQDD